MERVLRPGAGIRIRQDAWECCAFIISQCNIARITGIADRLQDTSGTSRGGLFLPALSAFAGPSDAILSR